MSNDLASIFGQNFNPAQHEQPNIYDLLVPGKYIVQITRTEVKATKAGDGHYLKLEMTILDGQYKNRKVWSQINIANPSAECVKIGLGELSALSKAAGIGELSDSAQLLNATIEVRVSVKGDQNIVRGYAPIGQIQLPPPPSSPPTTSPQQASPQQSGAMPKPPWAR